jgi:hypothetical protein
MKPPIVDQLEKLLPEVKFVTGEAFYWSPSKKVITYNNSLITKPNGKWALLHEASHAFLKHSRYSSDLALLKLEVDAWDYSKVLAKQFNLKINEDHIQDCLDTYRDWLYRRSTCPNCGIVSLQGKNMKYKCHNCLTSWSVSASRFCRPYRLTLKEDKEKRPQSKTATFS